MYSLSPGIAALKDYLLPPPAAVLNLFYALGCLVGVAPAQLQNVCGDPDWGTMQAVSFIVTLLIDSFFLSFIFPALSRLILVCFPPSISKLQRSTSKGARYKVYP